MSDFEDSDDWTPPTEAELKVIGKICFYPSTLLICQSHGEDVKVRDMMQEVILDQHVTELILV